MIIEKKVFFSNTLLKIIAWVVIVIAIVTNSGYTGMMRIDSSPAYFLLALLALEIIILVRKQIKLKINSVFYVYIVFMILVLITFFANREFYAINLYVNVTLLLTTSYLLTNIISFQTFITKYINLMTLISIISLFFYITTNYLNIVFPFGILYSSTTSYLNGHIFFQLVNNPLRNIGIFWEPGLFASFIIIAILFLVTYVGLKNNLKKMIILIATLFTTGSTAGYFLLIIVFMVLFIGRRKNVFAHMFTFLICIFAVFLLFFYNEIITYLVQINPASFSKLIDNSLTYTTRLYSPLVNFRIFLSSPIFGVGFSESTRIFIENSIYSNVDSQTSTSTYFLASMGFSGLLYTIVWLLGINSQYTKLPFMTKLLVTLVFLIILNKEPHNSLLISYCIMFFMLDKNNSHANVY